MKSIFEPVCFGNLQIKNRIIRSATLESGCAENGEITPLLNKIYTDLAKGNVGLIITGMMGVGYNSCVFQGMPQIYEKTFVQRFTPIVNSVHKYEGKIVVQLGHCGAKATVLETRDSPYSPSDFEIGPKQVAAEMTIAEIRKVAEEFGVAAEICRDCGADGVEIHAAHGYLLSQFFSPYYNNRTDCYGGNLENRSRFIIEVYNSVRTHVGENYPILIKLNYSDLIPDGVCGDDCIYICQKLEALGINGIEISSGLAIDLTSLPFQKPTSELKGCFTDGALDVANHISIPLISVGGYRSIKGIEHTLNAGNVSAISMSRPFICEPDLVLKWETGESNSSKCVSCNQCFDGAFGCKVFKNG